MNSCKCKKALQYRIVLAPVTVAGGTTVAMRAYRDGTCSRCGAHHDNLATIRTAPGDEFFSAGDMVLAVWPKGVPMGKVVLCVSEQHMGDIISALYGKVPQ